MPLTVRYVRANAAQGLDGLTLANAMNINDAFRTASGNSEYRILKDGLHVVTGAITVAPTGLSAFTPAYFVGCSDISGLVYADWQITGNAMRQRLDHMPQIMFSGVAYTNGVGPHCNFANLVMSGTVNGSMFNTTASYCNFHNLFVQNLSTGSSAVALGVGFRNNVTHCSCITSGIVNGGMALNLANSLNNTAFECYVSAPSGVGIYTNNPDTITSCVLDTCKRGVRTGSSSAGDGYVYGCTFINCSDYCVAQRNNAISHSGQLVVVGNFSYNSGPMTALVDSNGLIDLAYTTGLSFVQFNNFTVNSQPATGFDSHMNLSSATGNISATDLFVDISGKDLRYTARATGIYNRNMFGDGAGTTPLGNVIRIPRLL